MSDYPIIQTEAKKQERCSKHLSNKCNLSCLVRGPASKKRCDKCVKKEMDKNDDCNLKRAGIFKKEYVRKDIRSGEIFDHLKTLGRDYKKPHTAHLLSDKELNETEKEDAMRYLPENWRKVDPELFNRRVGNRVSEPLPEQATKEQIVAAEKRRARNAVREKQGYWESRSSGGREGSRRPRNSRRRRQAATVEPVATSVEPAPAAPAPAAPAPATPAEQTQIFNVLPNVIKENPSYYNKIEQISPELFETKYRGGGRKKRKKTKRRRKSKRSKRSKRTRRR
jgi:hypothetical protein